MRLLNILVNSIINRLNFNSKLLISRKLNNIAKILTESSFLSPPDPTLNGEQFWLKNSHINFRNVIDAGANRGDWTASLLSLREEVEKVVIIEPNEDRINDLKKRFGNEKRLKIIQVALDYREDNLNLIFKKGEHTHASLSYTSPQRNAENICVQKTKTTSIDNILKSQSFERIDLLKLDLEGFDHYGLLGARRALTNEQISVIQFEVTRFWETSSCSPCATFRLLKNYGFEIHFIKNKELFHLNAVEQLPHFSLYSNFCAIHRSIL